MPFLDKLVCFRQRLADTSPACQLCNIVWDNCDNPHEPHEGTDLHLFLQ